MTPRIRRASAEDAAALAGLAARTFSDTFGPDNTAEDLALHLASSYSPAKQAFEIADANVITIVAEHGDALVAFAQLRQGEAPACVTGAAPIELWRFYLSSDWHGRGLAQQLMSAVLTAAADCAARTLWLGVWERNPRAMAFYSKSGYRDVGSQVFVVGADAQTDRIMMRSLA